MGLTLCKSCCFCCSCCRCCCCSTKKSNSVGVLPERHLKVLLLGLLGSGKTHVGHILSRQQRTGYESTNGVQYYQMQLPERLLSITEVGGNAEMQKIWQHYYLTSMGIIYCFDMSASYDELQRSFDCLRTTLMHPCVRGKPVLLVATKADLVDEGVQLYDIENAFQLEALAKYYMSAVHLCYVGDDGCELDSLWNGIAWLIKYLIDNIDFIQVRIKTDTNVKTWQEHVNKLVAEGRIKRGRFQRFQNHLRNSRRRKLWYRSFGHFRAKRIRPHTAPAIINVANHSAMGDPVASEPTLTQEESAVVPNANLVDEVAALPIQMGKVTEV